MPRFAPESARLVADSGTFFIYTNIDTNIYKVLKKVLEQNRGERATVKASLEKNHWAIYRRKDTGRSAVKKAPLTDEPRGYIGVSAKAPWKA